MRKQSRLNKPRLLKKSKKRKTKKKETIKVRLISSISRYRRL